MKNESSISKILPVLFGFFVMGFVDVVGISTNYVKLDFGLSDTEANLLPLMVFLWFAVFSVPTGLVMNKFGRKRTVVLSMGVTFLALLLPIISYNFPVVLIAFAFLGIGNTILQVSLNPLVATVAREERLTSNLTLGQFIKSSSSFLGPVVAAVAASSLGNWRLLFPIFAAITLASTLWLVSVKMDELPAKVGETSSFSSSLGLLKDKYIFMLFLGIVFLVGIDVGLNTTIPKFLMERFHIPIEEAGFGTSLYFVARSAGSLIGAMLLIRFSGRRFYIISMVIAVLSMSVMLIMNNLWVILVLIFIIGLTIANIFSIIFSAALKRKPGRTNEISGLLIMGVAGGAIMPILMGIVSDSFGQTGGMAVLLIALIYLLYNAFKLEGT